MEEAKKPQDPEITENQDTAENKAPEPQADPQPESKREKRKREKEEKSTAEADKVEQMGEKLAEMNDKYLRLYSEYENYRKRTNLEKSDLILNGGKDVIKSILPVVDDMERAIQHTADETTRQGMELILGKLLATLGAKGLKPMEAKGEKFDEELHEAVTQFPAPDEEMKGKVVDVVEKGYFLNEKVLRYAKVVVGI